MKNLLGLKLLWVFCASYTFLFLVSVAACQHHLQGRESGEIRPDQEPEIFTHQSANFKSKMITFQAVGDLNLAGKATDLLHFTGMEYPFLGTGPVLAQGEVNFANLEAPITAGGQEFEKRFTFRMSSEVFWGIKGAGLNLFSLANNHIMDFGPQGLFDTMALLKKEGGYFAGAGGNLKEARKPAVFAINGIKIGFLAYSLTFPKEFYAEDNRPGTAFGHEHFVRKDVSQLREKVNLVIVSFHWGQEKSTEPKDYQILLARAAIDSGANVVIGHHPHVVQGIEHYKDGLIFYSLGNYAFGSYSTNVTWGILARTKWALPSENSSVTLEKAQVIFLNVNNFEVDFNPTPLGGDNAKEALESLNEMSKPFLTKLTFHQGMGEIKKLQ